MYYKNILMALVMSGCMAGIFAQETDKPFEVGAEVAQTFENSIAGQIQQAMKTLPEAKSRFMRKLPRGEELFLTIRIAGKDGNIEQLFVRVREWGVSEVVGDIANTVRYAKGYNKGQQISFGEGDILDWTIRKADGRIEGNYIGRYVDKWLGGQKAEGVAKK